ncbi:MAG: hypothetical protein ACLGI6_04880 [Gammaproteobacteria bacterium]
MNAPMMMRVAGFTARNLNRAVKAGVLMLGLGGLYGAQAGAEEAVATAGATAAADNVWGPFLGNMSGTYDSECVHISSGKKAGPIVVSSDGRFAANGIEGNVKAGVLNLVREAGANGKVSLFVGAREDDRFLVVTGKENGTTVIRVAQGIDGTECRFQPERSGFASSNLYSSFKRIFDVKGDIECAPISGPRKLRTLHYKIENGIVQVFDQVYDLKTSTLERILYLPDSGIFTYHATAKNGGSLDLGFTESVVDRVMATRPDGKGSNC